MSQKLILYPIFALLLLTMIVAVRMLMCRFRAVREGDVNPRYFLLKKGSKLPEYLEKNTNNFHNLLEFPPLFYITCVLIFVTQHTDAFNLLLAWGFVLSRFGHSYIHINGNQLKQRMWVFLLGIFLLVVLWLRVFVQLLVD